MRVEQLKEILEECEDHWEVRIANQPSWPFEHEVSRAWTVLEPEELDEGELAAAEASGDYSAEEPVLYIATGRQLRYLIGEVGDQLKGQGWG